MTGLERLQAAAHLAADEGWLHTNGGRVVASVAITLEGRRLALGAAVPCKQTRNRAATPALPRSSR